MNIHEKNYSGRRKSTCGYCREEGHNQYQCPHVKGDWENFLSRLEIPKDENGQPIRRGYNYVTWHSSGFDPIKDDICNNALASWFRNCKKAYIEQKKRGFNLNGTARRSTQSATKKCGFCGNTNHTRRNCPTMDKFLKDCYKANQNWRTAAYKEIVEGHGLSVGAVVTVKTKENYWSENWITHTAIVTDINWSTVNVFSALDKHSESSRSPLNIKVLVNGQIKHIDNTNSIFNCIGENGKADGYHGVSLVKVVTHSPTPLDPEWITSYKESFETLTRKRSYDQLKNGMASEWRSADLIAHVDKWTVV